MDKFAQSKLILTKSDVNKQEWWEKEEKSSGKVLDFNKRGQFYTTRVNSKLVGAIAADREDNLLALSQNVPEFLKKHGIADTENHYIEVDREYENSTYFLVYKNIPGNLNLMPPNAYIVTIKNDVTGFELLPLLQDEFLDLGNEDINRVKSNITKFFSSKNLYHNLGLRHKGAALLYGTPGCGKTSAILDIINSVQSDDIYTVYIPKHLSLTVLNNFKITFEGKKIIIVLEELTERLQSGTEDLLNFLDGYASWENCYVLATTNYPEQLPANLVDRPGRFNDLVEFKCPTESEKRQYLNLKGVNPEEIDKIVLKTKDMSFDYISQIVVQSALREIKPSEYISTLESIKKKVKGSFKNTGKLGL